MTVETLLKIGVVPSDEQLDCCHILGVATVKNDAFLVDEKHTWVLNVHGGIEFAFCPMCGLRLK